MARLTSRLKKAVRSNPRDVYKKVSQLALGYLKDTIQRRKDFKSCTYFRSEDFKNVKLKSHLKFEIGTFDPLDSRELESLMNHEFDLLGSGLTQVNAGHETKINHSNLSESQRIRRLITSQYKPIDWHSDFKSHYRWDSRIWAKDIRYGIKLGVDVKVPWELARFQHSVLLTQAKKGEEFQNEVLDFISSNPPRFGVNWVCSMDVAIRAVNWIVAWEIFRSNEDSLSSEFESELAKSLYEHGFHIRRNLEWSPFLRGNHYLSNLAGLIFISAYLPECLETKEWLSFAFKEFISEVNLQFKSDGGNFEASTSYHELSKEIVIFTSWLLNELPDIRENLDSSFWNKLKSILKFSEAIRKPSGRKLQIGDNDSGRFLKLAPSIAISKLPALKSSTPLSQFEPFPDFGLFIYRSDDFYLAIRCGTNGQNNRGGHAHNDQLSFELSVGSVDFIVDPGSYIYTADPLERNRFRSNKMHSTLSLGDEEQNSWLPGIDGVFEMQNQSKAKVLELNESSFIGEHYGFSVAHTRKFSIKSREILIEDLCLSSKTKTISIIFHPSVSVRAINEQLVEASCGENKIFLEAKDEVWRILLSEFSEEYGQKTMTQKVELKTEKTKINWKIKF